MFLQQCVVNEHHAKFEGLSFTQSSMQILTQAVQTRLRGQDLTIKDDSERKIEPIKSVE